MALRLRRGTDAERQSITPKQGELLYVTDTGLLYVGDGTTQGGNRVSGTIQDDESPTLSANLDLNGNDIVGNGNINIDGNITATGNINIGDGVEDNVIVGGTISSDLIPTTDTAFDLGSETFRWQNAHLTGLFVDGNISAESITVDTMFKDDSGVLYDALTDTLTANLIGNVYSQDSQLIIDSTENEVNISSINVDDTINSTLGNLDIGSEESPISLRLILKDNLIISQTIEGTSPPYGFITTLLSRGTLESPEAVQPGDEIGGIVATAYTDSETRANGGVLAFFVADDANIDGGNFIKTSVAITASKDTEQNIEDAFILDSDGVAESNGFSAKKYMQLPVFSDDTERSNKIDSPSKGMMIFIESGTNPSASNQMQIYNGTDWVNAS